MIEPFLLWCSFAGGAEGTEAAHLPLGPRQMLRGWAILPPASGSFSCRGSPPRPGSSGGPGGLPAQGVTPSTLKVLTRGVPHPLTGVQPPSL